MLDDEDWRAECLRQSADQDVKGLDAALGCSDDDNPGHAVSFTEVK